MRRSTRRHPAPVGLVIVAAILLTACNLGSQAPAAEPVDPNFDAGAVDVAPQADDPLDQADGGAVDAGALQPTQTPLIQVPPTDIPQPGAAETLGPITVDGTDHRAQEPITVKVRRGVSVSNLTCSWVLQDTNQTTALGTSTSLQIDDSTFEETFTFTPEAAGTYTINCNALATTVEGQRSVQASANPFTVEAKG